MREYAWYCPEIDCIVIQMIMEDCYISFSWDHWDLYYISHWIDLEKQEPMEEFLFLPLGEL